MAEVASGKRVFTEPLNIVYLYYSTDEDGVPTVCEDPNYSDQMRGCVRI